MAVVGVFLISGVDVSVAAASHANDVWLLHRPIASPVSSTTISMESNDMSKKQIYTCDTYGKPSGKSR